MRETRTTRRDPSRRLLAYAFFGSLTAWALQLGIGYVSSPQLCDRGTEWLLNVLTLITALIAAGSVLAGLMLIRSPEDDSSAPSRLIAGRSRFIGISGVVLGGVSLLFIVLTEFAILGLRCHGA
jgi:hypothetical protein